MADKEILNFTTTREHRTIKIDGKSYEILSKDDFNLGLFQRYSVKLDKIQKFFNAKTEQSDERYIAVLADLNEITAKIVLKIEDDKVKMLSDLQKMEIMTAVFSTADAKDGERSPQSKA